MRHRLFHRIFASLTVFVLLALVFSALASHLLLSDLLRTHLRAHLESRAAAFARALPGPDRPDAELQAALERACADWPLHAAVWGRDGRRLAFTLVDLPKPLPRATSSQWLESPAGAALAVPIVGGRVLVLQIRRFPRPAGFLLAVVALAGLLALASYPVARRMTRRLERLEAGVRRLGEGDLAARVEVRGDDELASLGRSFNLAAERLQRLVAAQRRVLASASHELRSPLTRLRMAVELAREDPAGGRERLGAAVDEIEELDALVGDLLLAGRLELQTPERPAEPVDVGALLADEAARTGAHAASREALVHADARLLRVLLRNLLENARRHGHDSPVEAGVEPLGDGRPGLRIWVADRGPGVAEAERERIFEPFYRPDGHAEARDGGVGLGLYLVRRIAECYGGTATCHPRDGGGTLFEVTLVEPPTAAKSGPSLA
jgi:signal transduction histidine kinase